MKFPPVAVDTILFGCWFDGTSGSRGWGAQGGGQKGVLMCLLVLGVFWLEVLMRLYELSGMS